uniref:Putative secreted protein n=1 Tax=Rhipicephalus microplus TaxID=6941 RepID=A0A6G5A172_RHIMP
MLITSCFVKCILVVRCHTKVVLQWLVFLAVTGTRLQTQALSSVKALTESVTENFRSRLQSHRFPATNLRSLNHRPG